MELTSLWLIVLVGCIMWGIGRYLINKRKQYIRDDAAKEVVTDSILQATRKKILSINRKLLPKSDRTYPVNGELLLKSNRICPTCKGVLISRKGKFGKFWGCSNYPKCKFTES